MEYIKDILALIVTISILVTVHEWGHYFVARLCGVRVLRFSVGFGTPLLSYRGKPAAHEAPAETGLGTRTNEPDEGTEFVIAAIPLGGYVKMLDEREGYVADDQLHLAFNRKPVLQRIAIVLAGPFANFLLAVLAYWILFTVGVNGLAPVLGHVESGSPADRAGLQQGQEILSIDGEPVTTWSQANLALFNRLGETGEIQLQAGSPGESRGQAYRIPIDEWLRGVETPAPAESLGMRHYPTVAPVIEAIVADGRAEQAGLLKGDRILAVNGEPVEYWFELERSIQAHPEKTMVLRVLRGGGELMINVVPAMRKIEGQDQGFLGVQRPAVSIPENWWRKTSYPVYSAWIPAVEKTWSVTVFTLSAVKKMIAGAISHKNLSGPITIARIASNTASSGFESFIGFLALLSISLGVLNLLPIPVLDGGHFLYYLVELVSGRPVPERVQVWGMQIGMILILSVMVLAFYNDILRL